MATIIAVTQTDELDSDDDPKNCRYATKRFNLWDRMFFGYYTSVVFRGFRNTLGAKDLQPLHIEFTARIVSEKILRLWRRRYMKQTARRVEEEPPPDADDREMLNRQEVKKKSINMVSLIFRAFWPSLLMSSFFYLLTILTDAIPPFLLGKLNDFLNAPEQKLASGFYIAGVLLLAQQLQSLLTAHVYGTLYNVGIKCRSGFSSMIYQKCLRLSGRASKKYPTGDIINLVSVDLENVKWWITMSNFLWGLPLSVILTFVLLYQYLGVYSLAGALAMILFTPFIVIMTKVESNLQTKHMKKKDKRVELITEVFNNVKMIKLYAWENSFIQKIRKLRLQETRLMYVYLGTCNAFGFAWSCYPFFVSAAAIAAYMFLNTESVINPKIVIVSIAYFNSLRMAMTNFPYSISIFAKAIVSLRRIREFLEADEIDPDIIEDDLEPNEVISFKNSTCSWDESEGPVLKGVNLSIKRGEAVAIVGSVGAGKSSLIQAIIGELTIMSGSISRRKSCQIAYVPQQAWILNNTVRNNILFGSRHEDESYREIVKKCCLRPDLKILQAGDLTEIGEKGVNLSGGQKQRVSLARAAYQNADIYLLDDPLSAVDAHVAQDLFKDVVGSSGLLKNKTRVLVTHSVAVLPYVDRIIVLEDGKVTHKGTYEEIMKENIRLKELVETHANTNEPTSTVDQAPPQPQEVIAFTRKRTVSVVSTSSSLGIERQISVVPSGRTTEEEEMQVGTVRWRVYLEFLWRFGILGVFLTLGGYILSKVAETGSLLYITDYSKKINDNKGTTRQDMWQHLQIYLAFGGVQAIAILVALTALSLGCIWTSTTLHNKMLDAVLKAPMKFFDSTPIGRILNRFSRDVDELDLGLYGQADGYLETLISLCVYLTWICIELPRFIYVLIPVLLAFLIMQKFYMISSRQIKRLSAVTKSPVLNCFNESISGITSIRAYNAQNYFVSKHMRVLDNNQNCVFHEYAGYRWLALRLNFVGSLIDFGVCCMLIYFREHIRSDIATLLFALSLQASSALTWIVRLGAQVENSLVSAERVLEYTKTTPEAPWYVDDEVNDTWPATGEVRFEGYSTRYKENLNLVLKDISLQFNAREKVGIVGRTGAGKSSLTLALLRVIEAVHGKILIDGVDISRIGLQTLRGRTAMIPQDPILFRGTLRENVDPEDRYTDEQVWAGLEKAHLKHENKPLTYQVDEGGSNLSVGERQLVCLARALLRNSKLLILDEATAAVDLETDALIQETIRQQFEDSTVITIAHRLHTIMDYDKIVVLDNGEVCEVGSPADLLSKSDGIFSSMAKDANIRINT